MKNWESPLISKRKINSFFLIFFIVTAAFNCSAAEPDMRAKNLFKQIRCSTCAGQSIDESNTPPAVEMRDFITQQISAGQSDAQILESIRAEHGDFLVFKPAFNIQTLMLWAMPFFIGTTLLIIVIRRTYNSQK